MHAGSFMFQGRLLEDSDSQKKENEGQDTPEAHFRFQRSFSIPLQEGQLLFALLLPFRLMMRRHLIHSLYLSKHTSSNEEYFRILIQLATCFMQTLRRWRGSKGC